MGEIKQIGLNSFQIKIIALVLMTFDHIHYMFSGIVDVPMWFTMIGRISAPLFIFMVAKGMKYTRSREKYLLKLYIGFVGMNLLNSFFGKHFPHPDGAMLIANIFSTLFIICLFIYAFEKIIDNIKTKKVGRAILFFIIGLIPVAGSLTVMYFMNNINEHNLKVLGAIMTTVPSILTNEGGYMFVILGLGFYLFGNSRAKQTMFYLIYCACGMIMNSSGELTLQSLFSTNIQWMMVFALPFIIIYNNKKGKSMKYFFYLYYPIHIFSLLLIARFISSQM